MSLLDVRNLHVTLTNDKQTIQAVRGISFSLNHGETVALVGESGCGKSLTAHALMGLLPEEGCRIQGDIQMEDRSLLSLSPKEWQGIRGCEIGMVFQDPLAALNPTMRIGQQIREGLQTHDKCSRAEAEKRALELMRLVGIPQPELRMHQYPHEYSGGMRQRVMIAIALACRPKLLIADEPTTSLDVTIQAQILSLLKQLQQEMQMTLLLITHDMAVVAHLCDRVMVMYAGRIIEIGTLEEIFYHPQHPYTQDLLRSLPHNEAILQTIAGSPPNLAHPPSGCPYWPRCRHAMKICTQQMPEFKDNSSHHKFACWLN